MTYKEMLAALAEKREAYKKLHAEIGVKAATDEQRSKLEALQGELAGLRDAIVREEEQRSTDAVLTGKILENADKPKTAKVEQRKNALNHYLRSGFHDLDTNERKVLAEMRGLNTGNGADGGFTIDTETLATVVKEKVSYGAAANMARVLPTGKGNPINWSVSEEGAVLGVIVGEEQNHGKNPTKFSNVELRAFKISSQIILISNELLTDSEVDMVSYITDIAKTRIDRGIDHYLVAGSGEKSPMGLIGQIKKTVSIDSAKNINFETLVDLFHGVDPAYRTSSKAAFGMHDTTLRQVRKLKDSNGDPIYLRDLTSTMPDRLLGMPAVIDNEFPTLDENKDGSIVFGDWNSLILRRVNGLTVKRLDELYAETDQVGFLAFARFDSLLEDRGAFVMLKIGATKVGG